MLFPVAEGGEVLPHGAAVVLHGPEAKASFTLTPAAPELAARAVSVEDNLLAGTYASKELQVGQAYYLQNGGFNRASTARTLEPFSCWLPYESKRNILSIDTATPIRPIQNVSLKSFEKSYNLSGQQVGTDYKGVIIRNGCKMLK